MSSPQGPEPDQDSPRRTVAADAGGRGRAPAVTPAGPYGAASRSGDDTGPIGAPPADGQPTEPQPAAARGGAGGDPAPTTVLPDGVRRPPPRPAVRPGSARTPGPRSAPATENRPPAKARRARLALQRIDPWSVFLYSLVSSIFLGIALVVAVFVLYTVLDRLGVLATVNELYVELTGDDAAATPLLTSGRFVGAALVLAAVNVVLLTLLATLSALLYNLCASFTGGIEVTLGERD